MGAGRVANADVSRAAMPGGRAGSVQTIPSLTLARAVKCPDPADVPWEGYPRQAKGAGVISPFPEDWESVTHSLTATTQMVLVDGLSTSPVLWEALRMAGSMGQG